MNFRRPSFFRVNSDTDDDDYDESASKGSFYVDHRGIGRGSILNLHDEVKNPQEIMDRELQPTDTVVIRILAKHRRTKKRKKKTKHNSIRKNADRRGFHNMNRSSSSSSSGDDNDSSSSSSSSSDEDDGDDNVESALENTENLDDVKERRTSKKLTEVAADLIGNESCPMWSERQWYVLDDLEIRHTKNTHIEVIFGRGNDAVVQRIHFGSIDEAEHFLSVIGYARRLQNTRAFRQDYHYRQAILDDQKQEPKKADTVSVLVEIVSACNLPPSNRSSADPYVSVYLGKTPIHQTKQIQRHLNPIWTVLSGSLFILRVPTEKLFKSSGLSFFVFDHDVFSSDFLIGKITVPNKDVLNGTGERKEYPLFTKKGSLFGASLALRFRPATDADVYFLRQLRKGSYLNATRHSWNKSTYGVNASTSSLPPRLRELSFMKRDSKLNKASNQREMRVKPWPDPFRIKSTRWLTNEKLHEECMKPGTHWVEMGSGGIGTLFLEILHADNLPNLDVSHLGIISGKTDAFCSILFEDCLANTDVINDTCQPKWMPWAQRNFIFRIKHPSSQLFLGMFDYDSESKIISHDPVGRVGVNLANFHPMMDYTLEYRLYNTANLYHRRARGTVTIRLRIEWDNNRLALLHPRHQPKQFHVGTTNRPNFLTAHYAVHGEGSVDDLDLKLLMAYWDELYELVNLIDPIRENLLTVLFWRGHYPVDFPHFKFKGGFEVSFQKVKLPLNSVVAFVGAITMAENFNLIPSYFCFGAAWFLLSMMGSRQKAENPWERCRSYWDMCASLISGKPLGEEIKADESFSAEDEALKLKSVQVDDLDSQAQLVTKQVEREKRRLWREIDKEEHRKVSSKRGSGNIFATVNPLKPYLFWIQEYLGQYCSYVRAARGIIEWDDSYTAFVLTNAFLILGFVFVLIPWGIVVRYVMRVTAWVFLGPWMKLVDLLYFESWKDIDRQRKIRKILEISQALEKEREVVHNQNEKALKMHDMISYYFGKYVVSPPRFKEYMHKDTPLNSSFAVRSKNKKNPRIIKKLDGQELEGEMIPEWVGAANWERGLATALNPGAENVGFGGTDESVTVTCDGVSANGHASVVGSSSRGSQRKVPTIVVEEPGIVRSAVSSSIAENEPENEPESVILPQEVVIDRNEESKRS